MKKLSINVDMDGIVADFHSAFLCEYKKADPSKAAQRLTTLDLTESWHCEKSLPNPELGEKVMDTVCLTEQFWIDMPLVSFKSVRVIKSWLDAGHDVHFLSTPWRGKASYAGKYAWVEKWFPMMVDRLTLTRHKVNYHGDLLIDDKPGTLKTYKKRWPDSHIATIAYAFHEKEAPPKETHMAESYAMSDTAWSSLDQYVDWIATR